MVYTLLLGAIHAAFHNRSESQGTLFLGSAERWDCPAVGTGKVFVQVVSIKPSEQSSSDTNGDRHKAAMLPHHLTKLSLALENIGECNASGSKIRATQSLLVAKPPGCQHRGAHVQIPRSPEEAQVGGQFAIPDI